MASFLTAAAWRAKHLTQTSYARARSQHRTAVVVGATSGIGEACADRLAEQGFLVVAVGRPRPGRPEQVVERLNKKSDAPIGEYASAYEFVGIPQHEFYPCDAFSLQQVNETADQILEKHPVIDTLIMTQSTASRKRFTPTPKEGNDEKMALHYYSRMTMTGKLLPALRKSRMSGGAVVLSVLSGGGHSAYSKYREDTDMRIAKNYSVANAANAAGFYNDLGLDHFASLDDDRNSNVNFVHAAPGFVNTSWGTELSAPLRLLVRLVQPFGRSALDCAEYLLSPTVLASEAGGVLPDRPKLSDGSRSGLYIVGANGEAGKLTKEHTPEAREFVWKHTVKVLRKAGIQMEE